MPLLNLPISQFLWLFVSTNIVRKVKSNILFLKWLASRGLTCYKVPEDLDLKKIQYKGTNDSTKKLKVSKGGRHNESSKAHEGNQANEFKIKSADLINLELKKVKLWPWMLQAKPYGTDLESVVDFACMSIVNFVFLELLFYYSAKPGDYNVSIIWITLVILQCLYFLLHLTSIYFKHQDSIGERSICIVSGCLFLLLAMLIMAFDGNRLELGINEAIHSWTYGPGVRHSRHSLLDLEETETLPPMVANRPTYTIVLKLLVSVICSLVGAVLTFPGFRFGQLHESHLTRQDSSLLERLLYNFNFLSPVLVICLWMPNITRNLLNKQDYLDLNPARFEILRTGILVFFNVLRLCLIRTYTESFLNSGQDRINRLRYRGGTISNKDVQLTINGINNYVNVVSLQYVLPALLCLFSSLMHAVLSQKVATLEQPEAVQISSLRSLFGNQSFVLTAERLVDSSRLLLASDIPKNVSSFATWWFHFAWLCTSTAGVVYHKYFTH